jgi:hypothetical protein
MITVHYDTLRKVYYSGEPGTEYYQEWSEEEAMLLMSYHRRETKPEFPRPIELSAVIVYTGLVVAVVNIVFAIIKWVIQ